MKTFQFFLLLSSMIALMDVVLMAVDPETIKIMPFVVSEKYCLDCHSVNETEKFKSKTTLSCPDYCMTCHDIHHPIGAKMLKHKPKPFIFYKRNKIVCFTCHDLSTPRFDSQSWESESMFDKVFDQQTKYKTFYLRVNNRDGDLCKQCH